MAWHKLKFVILTQNSCLLNAAFISISGNDQLCLHCPLMISLYQATCNEVIHWHVLSLVHDIATSHMILCTQQRAGTGTFN